MGLIRIAVNAVALLAAGLLVPGIEIAWSDDAAGIAITLLVLALVFGLVNASIGRIARLASIPLNILTLGPLLGRPQRGAAAGRGLRGRPRLGAAHRHRRLSA